MVSAGAEMHWTTNVDFDICHRMASLQNIVPDDNDLLFRGTKLNINISEAELGQKLENTLNTGYFNNIFVF